MVLARSSNILGSIVSPNWGTASPRTGKWESANNKAIQEFLKRLEIFFNGGYAGAMISRWKRAPERGSWGCFLRDEMLPGYVESSSNKPWKFRNFFIKQPTSLSWFKSPAGFFVLNSSGSTKDPRMQSWQRFRFRFQVVDPINHYIVGRKSLGHSKWGCKKIRESTCFQKKHQLAHDFDQRH